MYGGGGLAIAISFEAGDDWKSPSTLHMPGTI